MTDYTKTGSLLRRMGKVIKRDAMVKVGNNILRVATSTDGYAIKPDCDSATVPSLPGGFRLLSLRKEGV